MDFNSSTTPLCALSDQERIGRIKDLLSAIAANTASGAFDLEITSCTDDELKALPQDLPRSHFELLRQLGEFCLGRNGYLVIDTFTPRPWEDSDYCTPLKEDDRLPNKQQYLYMASDVDGQCYGYDITKKPFQIVSWDFSFCRPEQSSYPSLLDLIEKHIFEEFPHFVHAR